MISESHTVLVTGGTGFIGGSVVRALRQCGFRVRILATTQRAWQESDDGCEVHIGDIRDSASLQRAMKGIRYVCHLAAFVSTSSCKPAMMYDVNVQGTERLAAAALEGGVERLVHVSSNAAIEYTGSGIRNEKDIVPRTRYLTQYGHTKLEAERVIERAGDRGLAWIIVYPTRVIGAGPLGHPNAATRILAARLRGKLPVLPGKGKERANWVIVDDVADGIVRALRHGRIRERYILGGTNANLLEFFRMAEQIAGVSPFTVWIPHRLARIAASAEDIRSRLMRTPPRITRAWYDMIMEDAPLSIQKARLELGYEPTPLHPTLARIVAGLQQSSLSDEGVNS